MNRPTYRVTELLGDGIGAELSRAVHTLAELAARSAWTSCRSISRSRTAGRSGKAVYDEAVESINATKVALKYPTITAEESPNAVLRRRLDLSVIHRPVTRSPACRRTSAASWTWTSSASPPAGPTTTPAG